MNEPKARVPPGLTLLHLNFKIKWLVLSLFCFRRNQAILAHIFKKGQSCWLFLFLFLFLFLSLPVPGHVTSCHCIFNGGLWPSFTCAKLLIPCHTENHSAKLITEFWSNWHLYLGKITVSVADKVHIHSIFSYISHHATQHSLISSNISFQPLHAVFYISYVHIII